MNVKDVYSALRQDLAAMPGVPAIAYENVEFLSDGQPYLKINILPAPIVTPMFGINAQQRYEGIFQVMVLYPLGSGTKEIDTMVDALLTHFRRGFTLPYNGISVLTLKSWRGPGMELDAYYQIPISVQFQSYLTP